MESSQLNLPPNPRDRANCLSRIFFSWVFPLLKKGYRKTLDIWDLYLPLTNDRSELLGNRLEANWNKREAKSKSRSLFAVIFQTFWFEYMLIIIYSFCDEIILRLGQPFLLRHLMGFFRSSSGISFNRALLFASGVVILSALHTILFSHIYYISIHNGMRVRVAVCSLIYRKSLRLSQTAFGETSAGKVVNLISTDVRNFDSVVLSIYFLWLGPILTIIVGFLIWNEVGWLGLIGLLLVLVFVPFYSLVSKLSTKYRRQISLKMDVRIRFLAEILAGIQVIKMYAWEKAFGELVAQIRNLELKVIRKMAYVRVVYTTAKPFTTRIALFCTMLVILFMHGPEELTAERVFTISNYLSITALLMSQRFASSISDTAELMVALKRLQSFLDMEEKPVDPIDISQQFETTDIENPDFCISMRNVTARWPEPSHQVGLYSSPAKSKKTEPVQQYQASSEAPTLNDLNIDFPKGKLIGVIGLVGSGKSSLLQALLRELTLECGSIGIDGSISYASQDPWVFAASIRQNIIFGQTLDRFRYNAVIESCGLSQDIEQLPKGDLTIVGERGSSISGGQKARISLARACYREADIYLLDDPLSAVDASVGAHIFQKCLGPKGRLAKRRATRILVTHQVHFLKDADWLIVLKSGKVLNQGTPIEVCKSVEGLYELIGIKEPEDEASFANRAMSIASSIYETQSPLPAESDEKDHGVEMEASSKGTVKGVLLAQYFAAGAHWSVLVIILISCLLVQLFGSAADYWVSIWTKQEEHRVHPSKDVPFELSTMSCLYINAALIAALVIISIARSISYSEVCLRISHKIYSMMFNGIISTSLRFFDINPSGRILNRFSRDLGLIDEFIPRSILNAIQNMLSILGALIIVAVVNPYMLIPIMVLIIISYFIHKVYMRTSKDLQRLDRMAKSPAFTHLTATLNGLPTIRAFNCQTVLTRDFDQLQDKHTSCGYLIISTTFLFGLSLEVVCTIFITCIIFYFMIFDTGVSSAAIGLSVSQAMSHTGNLPWSVRVIAEVSNQMTSVERVLEYRDLKPEPQPRKPIIVDKYWPSNGSIEFRNVFYSYAVDTYPVLYDISFVIKPKQKIGIVGRTGAGKSSLIGAIFRLAHVEGDILIDDINTSQILLSDLRKQIAIIPQDPVLFSGTLRRNLDPFDEYSDGEIWSALESVELRTVATDFFGLQSTVLPQGTNFSVGQRQLLCLARAILRKNKIVVLDEATANVDPVTDKLIQRTIRERLAECTVLTVAHRLHSIIDSDRVLVIDDGKAVEFDKPYNLLQNTQGLFYNMIKALSESEFARLTQIALEKYLEKKNSSEI